MDTQKTFLWLVVFVVLSLTAVPVAAQTPGKYTGATSQEYPMELTVMDLGGKLVIQQWGFNFDLNCQKSGAVVGVGMGFFGFNVPIEENGAFKFQFQSLTFVFAMHGAFTDQVVGGVASTTWAAINPLPSGGRVEAELCESGRVRWSAILDDIALSLGLSPGENDISISLVRDPQTGRVSEILTR